MNEQDQLRALVREAMVKWHADSLEAFQGWNLETVRTLAIVNSGGLAGVSAIYASENAAKIYLGNYPAAAFFAVGLICALLNMYANSRGHISDRSEIADRIKKLDTGELDAKQALDPLKSGRPGFLIAEFGGWSAFIMFCAGGWPFVHPALAKIL
ncbi:hypothetical protein RI103_06410 [Paraburkholderia sp. FT54]|uniref:hypothetical protein n=1 Tax=Paraburkholderia sp. FT54 TaxID=3074437 RepID=UPI002877372F|nr:hypothetical protein [Paraburkholderia sp. FT54]WNC90980.1 hypothetical protein RI103_06410 [Paraburkholderia sp. FT54]